MTLVGMMQRRWAGRAAGAALMAMAAGTTSAAAQDTPGQTPMQTPARIAVEAPARSAVSAEALLAKPVTVTVEHVSIDRAIDALGAAAGTTVFYKHDVVVSAVAHAVTFRVHDIPLGEAFARLLDKTGLQLVTLPAGQLGVIPMQASTADGVVTGRVTNSNTKRPVQGASVWLDDSTHAIRTDENGHFRFVGVSAGPHRVMVRAVGFGRQTRVVTVGDGTVTVDVALSESVNTLDQVVVTATGEQRVRELGHVVARINADSLTRSAPITNLTDLLQSRVPGLQVFTGNGGMAGGEVSLRLRGTSTMSLSAEPIVIVDGVRYKSNNLIFGDGAYLREDTRGNGGELNSPLNDINPNDVESIEVVKGPSASTLYGPDAANGVIVVTTKRGKAGQTQFKWYAHPVSTSVPKLPTSKVYQAWAHDSSGALFGDQCTVLYQYQFGICILDSITVVPATSANSQYAIVAKDRPTWQYGANVSGGVSSMQYFVSGNYNTQDGVMQVPPAAQAFLKKRLGVSTISEAVSKPNTLQQVGTHANMSTSLFSRGTLGLNVDYVQGNHTTAAAQVFAQQYVNGNPYPGMDTTNLTRFVNPTFTLYTSDESSSHFTSALSGDVKLFPWLNATGSAGVDVQGIVTHSLLPAGQRSPTDGGLARDDRRSSQGRTLTGGLTAMAHPGIWSFRSSVGAQYIYTHLDGVSTQGSGLAPGSNSISTAQSIGTQQLWSESVDLGTYGEEVVGLLDRFFVTGSLRLDGSTTFGDAYRARPYPKLGLSWIASDEPFFQVPGVHELRFRASYGASSNYPTSGMKFGTNTGGSFTVEGTNQNYFYRPILANQSIRAERTREGEYGADLTVLNGINMQLTWNRRRIADQLQLLNYASGLAPGWANIGEMSGHGFEATATVPLFNAHGVSGDLGVTYSHQVSKLVSLGGLPEVKNPYGNGYTVGYPLGALFGNVITGVADTVGGHADSIIFTNEIVRDSVQRYLGATIPPTTMTFAPALGLFNGRIRVSALFDRQTGFLHFDQTEAFCGTSGLCLTPFLRYAPVMAQAKYAAFGSHVEDFLEPGDFTRWRELSVIFDVPQRFLHLDPVHLHFSSASLTLSGRNLALWTKFKGLDPESGNIFPSAGDISALTQGIPQARAWAFRFDITP